MDFKIYMRAIKNTKECEIREARTRNEMGDDLRMTIYESAKELPSGLGVRKRNDLQVTIFGVTIDDCTEGLDSGLRVRKRND
jgi:hypothetical protein